MVLGGRHLVGIFLVLVVVFAVVFTLGYLLGRSQYDSSIRAASAAPAQPSAGTATPLAGAASAAAPSQAQPPPADWDFYHSAEPAKSPARLAPQPKKELSAAKRPVGKTSKRRAPARLPRADRSLAAPLIPRGASVLQVAALTQQTDALALAQALQRKKFPAFVLMPATDRFYRVQVGPYADARSAGFARRRLEKQGFKSIVKR
jgi:cell division septation protein DedD